MQSSEKTVLEYIQELPEDRKRPLNYYVKQSTKTYPKALKKA
ncbi:MAG: hypothetical protein V9E96_00920 [Chitinophagaceae bacterium]